MSQIKKNYTMSRYKKCIQISRKKYSFSRLNKAKLTEIYDTNKIDAGCIIDSIIRTSKYEVLEGGEKFLERFFSSEDQTSNIFKAILEHNYLINTNKSYLSANILFTENKDIARRVASLKCKVLSDYKPQYAQDFHPECKNIVICMQVKDEEDIIYSNLLNSYILGARKYVILENNSSDQTLDEIKRFINHHPDCKVVIIADPIEAHYQADKMQACANFAKIYFEGCDNQNIDFVLPLDADEFITFSQEKHNGFNSIVDIMNREENGKGFRFLQLRLINMSPSAQDITNIFTNENHIFTLDQLNKYFKNWDQCLDSAVALNPLTKILIRSSDINGIQNGNHRLNPKPTKSGSFSASDIAIGDLYGIYISHYTIRSNHHLEKKVINGGKALLATNLPVGVGLHWRRNYANYLEQGMEFIKKSFSQYLSSGEQAQKSYESKYKINDIQGCGDILSLILNDKDLKQGCMFKVSKKILGIP